MKIKCNYCSVVLFVIFLLSNSAWSLQKSIPNNPVQQNVQNKETIDKNWLRCIKNKIKKSEYHISAVKGSNQFQSPNRKNNLRITYFKTGFSLVPRDRSKSDNKCNRNAGNWKTKFALKSIQNGKKSFPPLKSPRSKADKNKLISYHQNFNIEYTNNKKGMRQNFIVFDELRSEQSNNLKVNIKYQSSLLPFKSTVKDGISFKTLNSGKEIIGYKDLKVWDAE
ncbi:MAG: hypothetical protein ABEH43_05725, partial [Flavobacteriales bacterium]